MNDDALKKLWREQSLPPASVPPPVEQIKAVKQKMADFDKIIRRRDFREDAAGIFVIACFGLFLFMNFPVLSRVGCVVTMVSAAFTMWYPRWCKRKLTKAGEDAAVIEFLQMELAKVNLEIRLLQSVLWWYIVPLGIGGELFFFGGYASLATKFTFLAFSTALSAFIWWLNQYAVKKQLMPLKEALESLLKPE